MSFANKRLYTLQVTTMQGSGGHAHQLHNENYDPENPTRYIYFFMQVSPHSTVTKPLEATRIS